jgi:hypothetical protein
MLEKDRKLTKWPLLVFKQAIAIIKYSVGKYQKVLGNYISFLMKLSVKI